MPFKECQGLKALAAHLSPNFLLSAPRPPNNWSSILLSFKEAII